MISSEHPQRFTAKDKTFKQGTPEWEAALRGKKLHRIQERETQAPKVINFTEGQSLNESWKTDL